jgi:hypothetical protein
MMAGILLNFLLMTVIGGFITFSVSALHDSRTSRESALSSLRDLIKQVDDLYRSTKQIKRMIRSRLKEITEGYAIDAAFFAAQMDNLSNTQLQLEQVRNAVRTRLDLFDGDRKKRILKEVEYSEKYLCDVVEEFEKQRVGWEDSGCRISTSCKMLIDFLGERWMPTEIEDEFQTMDDAPTSLERFNAFQSIVDKAKKIDPDYWRHKTISDTCMLLAIREMSDIIFERQPGLALQGLIPSRRRQALPPQASVSPPNGESS